MKRLTELTQLICVGVEKCGTTSLDQLFRGLHAFACPTPKETFFFSRDYEKGLAYYESLYDLDADHRYFIDFTPSYFRNPQALQRISRFPARKRILFMMRNPLRRAFSFYVHDIFNHICVGQRMAKNFERPVTFSFYDFFINRSTYYFVRYSETINKLYEIFGKENVCLVVFEDLISDFVGQMRRIERFIDYEIAGLQDMRLPHSNRITLPYYLYPTAGDLEIAAETGRYRVPRNRLCVARNGILQPLNCDADRASNALALQGSWTNGVQLSQAEDMARQLFGDDIRAVEDLIGRPLPAWRTQKPLRAEKMDIFSAAAAAMDPKRFEKFRRVFAAL